ncbi:hypothetical protein [Moraxella catarrhalis]|uniref:hypothetical protein n=1 Tax=Moraxella catarrhalis TaxID=480 RepID=UPI001293AA82|nr:hypothetical protein [Moraxella catarrhalis]
MVADTTHTKNMLKTHCRAFKRHSTKKTGFFTGGNLAEIIASFTQKYAQAFLNG